ncbi:MAG: hypothetical protein H6561_05100 [Lewinellaceae bacterium]|nr:hypothetical protein [Lewinellaceae bacterium]
MKNNPLLALALLAFCLIIFISFLVGEFIIRPKRIRWSQGLWFCAWLVFEIALIGSISFLFYNVIGDFMIFTSTAI